MWKLQKIRTVDVEASDSAGGRRRQARSIFLWGLTGNEAKNFTFVFIMTF